MLRLGVFTVYLRHEHIEYTHSMALVHQFIHEVRTDKPGATRNQHVSFVQNSPSFPRVQITNS